MTSNKFKVNRELKVAAPKGLVKQLNELLGTYGAGRTLMTETGLSYPTIKQVAESGLATQSTIDLLEGALKKIAA